jgi:hypothetical protein
MVSDSIMGGTACLQAVSRSDGNPSEVASNLSEVFRQFNRFPRFLYRAHTLKLHFPPAANELSAQNAEDGFLLPATQARRTFRSVLQSAL